MSSATLDRSGLIEKAASLVQRGDLNGALKHYIRLFDDSPTDWNVANTLGDLYVRVGRSADAVAHFTSLAEQLAVDGFTAKARALYRKILRIQPTNAAALQRVEELDRHGQSASPFLQRVLQTARASRETLPEPEPVAAIEPPAPAPPIIEPPAPAPPPPPVDVWNPHQPQPIAFKPAPAFTPAPPHVAPPPVAPVASAERGLQTPLSQPAHTPLSDTPLSRTPVSETPLPQTPVAQSPLPAMPPPQPAPPVPTLTAEEEFTAMTANADAAAARGEFCAAVAAIEAFLVARPHHVPALEKLIDVGVEGCRDRDLPFAQVRLAEACLEIGRYQQAQDIAIDLIFREPGSTRHQDLLERVTTAARERRQSLRAVPPLAAESEEVAAHPAPPLSPVVAPPIVMPPASVAVPVAPPPAVAAPVAAPPAIAADDSTLPADLREWSDSAQAFDDIRTLLIEEAAAAAEDRLAEAIRLIDAGDTDHAVRALEEAMCAPHLRATAGARLASLYRDVGAPIEALACLEWVAEMPPPNEDSGHELAYQLALTLEALGQQAQALGVYRELLAEVGPSYRDVASRTTRLSAA